MSLLYPIICQRFIFPPLVKGFAICRKLNPYPFEKTTVRCTKTLAYLLGFIAAFHLIAGVGLMFFPNFQKWAASAYGATLAWDNRDVYFIRIIGTFAFALGLMAARAAQDPARNLFVPIVLLIFFALRDVQRHLYWSECSAAFSISPETNNLTSLFFGAQAIALLILVVMSQKELRKNAERNEGSHK